MQVRIFKPAKSPTQSGQRDKGWVMEYYCAKNDIFTENRLGRCTSNNTLSEIRLFFSSKESAVKYAQQRKYAIELIEPKMRKIEPKSYCDNFK